MIYYRMLYDNRIWRPTVPSDHIRRNGFWVVSHSEARIRPSMLNRPLADNEELV